jgi:hypothetical protein
VKLRGRQRGSELFLEADGSGGSSIETLAAAQAFSGEQRTIAVVVDFSDAQVTCTPQSIDELLFTDGDGYSVDALLREMTFEGVWLRGHVVGPVTIDYSTSDSCNTRAWSDAADAELLALGVDPSSYDRRVYVLPDQNPCGFTGYGEVGGAAPTRAWVSRCAREDLYAHELGHGFGMHHASTPTYEYGDGSDIMGPSGRLLRQVNAAHQHQMGWLDSGAVVDVVDSGDYEVAPLELAGQQALAPQILRIFKADTNEYYYLSYRRALGFDANLASIYVDGLAVHRYPDDGSLRRTYLLAQLSDGQSFSDPTNEVTITTESHDANLLRLRISLEPVEPTGDESPPSPPSGLVASLRGRHVQLSWTASSDNVGVVAYSLWRDGAWLAETTELVHVDLHVGRRATHEYWVIAHDAAGNASEPSASAPLTSRKRGR